MKILQHGKREIPTLVLELVSNSPKWHCPQNAVVAVVNMAT